MKRAFIFTVAIVLVSFLCVSILHATTDKSKLPDTIGIGTTSLGSTGNSMAVAYAPVLEKWLGGVKVRVMPAESVMVMVGRMRDQSVLFHGGGISVASLGSAIQGAEMFASEGWGPQSKIRVVWYNYTCPFGIVVRGDSKIQSMADLKGKKGAMYRGSTMWMGGFDGSLALAGLTRDDVTIIQTGGYSPCAQAVAEGRADFTYLAPISTITYEIEQNPNGIRWLPMPLDDKAAWGRFLKKSPLLAYGNCETGVQSARGLPMQRADFVVAAWDDAKGIYQIAKFFDQAFDQYKGLHKNAPEMSIQHTKQYMSLSPIPFHPETIKYLREKDIWTAQDDKWNQEQIELINKYEAAWKDAVKEGKKKGLKIHYKNMEWMNLWNSYRSKLPLLKTR